MGPGSGGKTRRVRENGRRHCWDSLGLRAFRSGELMNFLIGLFNYVSQLMKMNNLSLTTRYIRS